MRLFLVLALTADPWSAVPALAQSPGTAPSADRVWRWVIRF
jgi:hypothetical protein